MEKELTVADIAKDFPDVQILSLEDHIKVESKKKTYLIQILHNPQNAAAPWDTNVYAAENGKWQYLADLPWRMDKRRESAIRTTFSFLQDL